MFLETSRLKIHTANKNEMEQYIASQSDDALITAYKEMLQGFLDHPEHGDWYGIWMINRHDGTNVGDLSFKGFSPDGAVEIGYGILDEYRCHGYATEAVAAVVAWALEQDGVTRVEAEADADNIASRRVLEKCGFAPAGVIGEEGPRYVRWR